MNRNANGRLVRSFLAIGLLGELAVAQLRGQDVVVRARPSRAIMRGNSYLRPSATREPHVLLTFGGRGVGPKLPQAELF
jgi:hypothetical protein